MAALHIGQFLNAVKGDGTRAKTLRASIWTGSSIISANVMRLLSNLILTRLLFPEAFGLMALTQIFIFALSTFSDVGIRASIIQNKRGDDPDFLDTAWTLGIIRGCSLWLGSCALAWPAAQIYGEPELMYLLPVTALALPIASFVPTRVVQADRHMTIGRQTMVYMATQFIALLLTALLAWWLRSVWALAFASIISALMNNLLMRIYLPGRENRLRWEPEAARALFGFGKFIFLSTMATFLINMGDKAILGAYVDAATMGIFSIALTLGSLPGMVVQTLVGKVLFPLYRIKPPGESADNRRKVFKVRRVLLLVGTGLTAFLAFASVWLIELMYDSRYLAAGAMVILIVLRGIPIYVAMGPQNVLLASGDSRRHFFVTGALAVLQTLFTLIGVHYLGIVGAILGPGVAQLAVYPFLAAMIARYDAWDPLGDLGFMGLAFVLTGIACALYWPDVVALF